MELIFDGLLAVGLLLALFWGLSLRRSMAQDRAEADKAREQAEREARLTRKGEHLRCLNCEKTFRGPLDPMGCPRCHLSSLVVPEAEYQENLQKKTKG